MCRSCQQLFLFMWGFLPRPPIEEEVIWHINLIFLLLYIHQEPLQPYKLSLSLS